MIREENISKLAVVIGLLAAGFANAYISMLAGAGSEDFNRVHCVFIFLLAMLAGWGTFHFANILLRPSNASEPELDARIMDKVILPEHLLLSALNLTKVKPKVDEYNPVPLSYGVAAAVLMELSQRGRITIDGENLKLVSLEDTGDDVLDTAIANIGESSSTRKVGYWISQPDSLVNGLLLRLQKRLESIGLFFVATHYRFLGLFPDRGYATLDKSTEPDIRKRILDVVLRGAEADETVALMIVLVHACNLAADVFPGENIEEVKKALKEFAEGDLVAKAVPDQGAAATMTAIISAVSTAMMSNSGK